MTTQHDGLGWPTWIDEAYEAWNRGDADALVARTHPDVEVIPLLGAVTSVGPWNGHEAVARLVEEAKTRWGSFTLEPLHITGIGNRFIVRARVVASVRDGMSIDGEVEHVIDLRDGLVVRVEARRAG